MPLISMAQEGENLTLPTQGVSMPNPEQGEEGNATSGENTAKPEETPEKPIETKIPVPTTIGEPPSPPVEGENTETPSLPEGDWSLAPVSPGDNNKTLQENGSKKETVWDENTCDHANPNCVDAPICTIPNHNHISYDNPHQLPQYDCNLGKWLLEEKDKINRSQQGESIENFNSEIIGKIDLNKGDVVLYNSGSYVVENGNGAESITVAAGRVVALYLQNTLGQNLVFEKGVRASIKVTEQNQWDGWKFPEEGSLYIVGPGSLTAYKHVLFENTDVKISSGNINFESLTQLNNLQKYRFPGENTQNIAVKNQIIAQTPDKQGDYYVWLPPLDGGMKYVSGVEGSDTLIIWAEGEEDQNNQENAPDYPQPAEEKPQKPIDSKDIILSSGETYTLSSLLEEENGHYQVTFAEEGSLLKLNNISLAKGASLTIKNIQGSNQIIFEGENAPVVIENGGNLDISGNCRQITYSGQGEVNIGGSGGNIYWQGEISKIKLLNYPAVVETLEKDSITEKTVFMNQGSDLPLLWTGEKTFLIPQNIQGQYRFEVENDLLQMLRLSKEEMVTLQALHDEEENIPQRAPQETVKTIHLSEVNQDIVIEEGTNYHIIGTEEKFSHQVLVNPNYQGKITLEKVYMESLIFSTQGKATLTLIGENQISFLVAGGSDLTFSQGGNLTIEKWEGGTGNIIPLGNVKILGDEKFSGFVATVLLIVDNEGRIPQGKTLTVKVEGKDPYQAQLFKDGSLWIWEKNAVDPSKVTVNDESILYTPLIKNGERVEINQVQGNGETLEVEITFNAPMGNSAGIMYLVGSGSEVLEEGYMAQAKYAPSYKDSKGNWKTAILQGVSKGQVLTFRVFASPMQGLTLNETTQNLFTFSDPAIQIVVEGKKPLAVEDILPHSKFYDGKGYGFINLPQGVQVSFLAGNGNLLDTPPINAGSYKAVFEVEENHPDYFKGLYEKPIIITKTKNPVQITVMQTTYGQKLQTHITENMGGEPQITYLGIHNTVYQSNIPPIFTGNYEVHAFIPGNENVDESRIIMPFNIYPKKVYILPVANQFKFQGAEDPIFTFYYDGLLETDKHLLEGFLFRLMGEEPGTYQYDVSYLSAGENYTFDLHPFSDEFTILPDENGGEDPDGEDPDGEDPGGEGPGGEGSGSGMGGEEGDKNKIIPVHQKIKLENGKTLDIILNTTQVLTINKREYSNLIFDTVDHKIRYFKPAFRITEDGGQVLLHLETEPELKKDGGYATDIEGNKIYRGRRLELTYSTIEKFKSLGITHINLGVKNASVLLPLDDLISTQMESFVKEEKSLLNKGVFHINITPQIPLENLALEEKNSLLKENMIGELYRLEINILLDKEVYDISSLLPNVSLQVGVEDILKLMDIPHEEKKSSVKEVAKDINQTEKTEEEKKEEEKVEKEEIKTEENLPFQLVNISSQGKLFRENTLLIEPFMDSESQMLFQGLRGTQRYLTVKATQEGVYFINFVESVKDENPKENNEDEVKVETEKEKQ